MGTSLSKGPDCPFCGTPLAQGPPWAPGQGHKLAYDPEKGRLWNVCPGCSKWTLTPMDSRWETLEACEEAVRRTGKSILSTPHLSLISVGDGELIRVGRPGRPEFVGWRYGPTLVEARPSPGFWARLLSRLPAPPVGGYDPYKGFEGAVRSQPWLASPFLEKASVLTYLFSQVPLAKDCPSCRRPLALNPWDFQAIAFLPSHGLPELLASCALCRTEVPISLSEARPTLRMGLGLVTPRDSVEKVAEQAARELDGLGGATSFLNTLASGRLVLGDLDLPRRAGLIISLDEMAEVAALEAEWRLAEELAAIMDSELTRVPGFENFRKQIMDGDG